MKIITANHHGKKVKIKVSNCDFKKLSKYTWWIHNHGYAMTIKNKKTILMHRLILKDLICKEKNEVDHINLEKLDNRRKNLRVCTRRENGANREKENINQSGYKGVCRYNYNKDGIVKWAAYIRKNGKTKNLGYFLSPVDAAKAYNMAAKKMFEKFARLNKI